MYKYLFTILILFTTKAHAGFESICNGDQLYPNISTHSLNLYLNCLATRTPISRLGAQWLMLRKSHWQLEFEASSEMYSFEFAENPQNPNQANQLIIDPDKIDRDLSSLVARLEREIFPLLLNGGSNQTQGESNQTSWSFESTVYQTVAFMDTPIKEHWRKTEDKNTHYMGTLFESEKFPNGWFNNIVSQFDVLKTSILWDHFWPELRQIFKSYDSCPETKCYYHQEAKFLQALLVTLENPNLVQLVHKTRHDNFGVQSGEFAESQESLPNSYGCDKKWAMYDVPTGVMFQDYCLVGEESKNGNYAQFKKFGLLGRPLYLKAINVTKIKDLEKKGPDGEVIYSGQFQGQNAIVRSITDAAVKSLEQMEGGLGGSEFAGIDLENADVDDIINSHLKGASYWIADYQRKKYRGESLTGHPVLTQAFFTQTVISKGFTLLNWIDLLSRLNPPVFYQIFAYDYGLRSFATNNEWRGYYDRILFVIDNYTPSLLEMSDPTNSIELR